MVFQEYINELNQVKKSVADGKNSIGSVVGGNQDSTFQVLANNAQHIKNERNDFAGQIQVLNNQLMNMTNDRNNWINVANSKVIVETGIAKPDTLTTIKIPYDSSCYVMFFKNRSSTIFFSGSYVCSKDEDNYIQYLGEMSNINRLEYIACWTKLVGVPYDGVYVTLDTTRYHEYIRYAIFGG